jgi:hypothetical protein
MSAHSEAAKLFFLRTLKPTQEQFALFIDWLRFDDKAIAYDDLNAELQAFFAAARNTISRIKIGTSNNYTVVDGDEIIVFKNATDYVEITLPVSPVRGRRLTFIIGCDSSGFPTPITARPVLKLSGVTANGTDGDAVVGADKMITIVYHDTGDDPFWQVIEMQ